MIMQVLPSSILIIFSVFMLAGPPSTAVAGSPADDAGSVLGQAGLDHEALLKVGTEPPWGIAMGVRYAKIPFHADDSTVADVFPLLYFEGKHIFLRGKEGGFKLWQNPSGESGVNLLGRYRFFDIPKEFQNEIRGDALDMGIQAYWNLQHDLLLEAELLSDVDGRVQAIGRLGKKISGDGWWLTPELEMIAKTSYFNSRYYGLNTYDVDAGIQFKARLHSRMHVWSNLYLEGSIEAGLLDNPARDSQPVNTDLEWEAYLGLGFFELPEMISSAKSSGPQLLAKPYWRLAQGWGTSSSLAQIIDGDIRTENVDVDMTSLFYGHPLSDTLFGLPIELYLTPGLVHHYSSDDQGAATEYVLGIKAYYTLPLPWRIRIGVAEGISYTDSITYYEAESMEDKDYRASKLLNYLDFSFDLNLGDVFCADTLEDLWLGYSIHHRSGIFESSSAFGRISGGSNFNTVYLQWSGQF